MTKGSPDDGFSSLNDEQGCRDSTHDRGNGREVDPTTSPDTVAAASGPGLNHDVATSLGPPRNVTRSLPVEFGDYRLLREIGQGGMGIVFEAEQKSLGNRRLAIKMIKYLGEINDGAVRRFETEVQAVAQLEHRNIVPVYHLGVEAGTHYYAMKLIDGKNLRELIRTLKDAVSRQQRTTVQQDGTERSDVDSGHTSHESGWSKGDTLASNDVIEKISATGSIAHPQFMKNLVRMGIQVADALHHVHEHGIVHRDVKPANLILDVDGDVWLTDFGLALISDNPALTAPGDLVGTYSYMSPEQAMGSKRVIFDHRSDIYSLGATLYELLALRRAFPGRTREEILYAVQFEAPPPIRSIAPRVPKDLETIVMKALAKDPNARFQSAAEMAAELRRFQEGKPLTVRPPGVLEKFGYWARANRQLVASVAAIGLVTVIATIFSLFQSMRAQQAETESELKVERVLQAETQKALIAETNQKNEAKRQHRQSEGLRLAANSALQLDKDATLALRLSIEAGIRHPGADANDALMNAVDALHEAMILSGHTSPVGHVAFSHDGSKLVSSAGTKTFRPAEPTEDVERDEQQVESSEKPVIEPAIVWDPETGVELGRLQDSHAITSAVFSPDDDFVLTAGSPDEEAATNDIDDKLLAAPPCLWSASDFSQDVIFEDAFLFKAHRGNFNQDGSLLVLPTLGNKAAIYSRAGVKVVELTGHEARVAYATFSPSGNRVATASADNTIRIWNVRIDNGEPRLEQLAPLEKWKPQSGAGQSRDIAWLEFGPDGRMLFTGSWSRGIEIWDLDHPNASISAENILGRQGVIYANGSLLMTPGLGDKSVIIRRVHDADGVEHQRINLLVRKAVISPDNRVLGILGYGDGRKFHLWDLERKKLRATLGSDDEFELADLVFSPDSKLIATACEDMRVRLWHVSNGRERFTFPARRYDGVPLATASPDGKMLAIASHDARHVGEICSPDLSQRLQLDAKIILPPSSGEYFLAVQGKRLAVHASNDPTLVTKETALTYDVLDAVINSRGDRVAAYCGREHVVLWFTDQDRQIRLPIGSERLRRLQISPATGNVMSIGLDGMVRVWDSETGRSVATFVAGDNMELAQIEWSGDASMYALTTNRDTAILLDATTHKEIKRFQSENVQFDRIRFSFDNKSIITYSTVMGPQSTPVRRWDIASGDLLDEFPISGRVYVRTNPGKAEALLMSDKDGAYIWNYGLGERIPVTTESTITGNYSPDGEHFYLGNGGIANSATHTVQEWEETDKAPRVTRWVRSDIQRMESIYFPFESLGRILFDPKGRVIVNASRRNQVINYEVNTRTVGATIPGHCGPVSACLFTSDGERMITTSWDAHVSLWNASTGQRLGSWSDHGSPITSGSISRDDRSLVTGGRDGRVLVWDLVESNAETASVRTLNSFTGPVQHTAIAPDGRRLLAISGEFEFKLYESESLQQIEVGLEDLQIKWAEFSNDSKTLLAIPRMVEATDTPQVLVVSLEEGSLSKFEYPGTVRASHFGPDSKQIVTTFESIQDDDGTTTKTAVVSITEIESMEVKSSFVHDASSASEALLDPSGEYLVVRGQDAATAWRVSDGRRWMTMEDKRFDHRLWHYGPGSFIPGQPVRVVTRRRDTSQFRDYPLIPLSAPEVQSTRPLSELEADRFHISK